MPMVVATYSSAESQPCKDNEKCGLSEVPRLRALLIYPEDLRGSTEQ